MKRLIVVIMCCLMATLIGCKPKDLPITVELHGPGPTSDFDVIGTVEVTSQSTEVPTIGATSAVIMPRAENRRGETIAMHYWDIHTFSEYLYSQLSHGYQLDPDVPVEVNLSLLDSESKPHNIGVVITAWWNWWNSPIPIWKRERSFAFVATDQLLVYLNMNSKPVKGGVTNPAAGRHGYPPGMPLTIDAEPYAGWQFEAWKGNVEDTANSTTRITLGKVNESVEADFVPQVNGMKLTLYLEPNPDGGYMADL